MAIIPDNVKGWIRWKLANLFPSLGENIDYHVDHINGAIQALEDWIESPSVKNAISNTINQGSDPYVFNTNQKKYIFAYFIFQKARREGII